MNRALYDVTPQQNFVLTRLEPPRSQGEFAEDVRTGLRAAPKRIPPRYFYDAHGSELFERICRTPEYYLTRAENALLREVAGSIIEQVRPHSLLELGSGDARKTEHLLTACAHHARHACYLPLDVCDAALVQSGQRLLGRYPWLRVRALVGDYSRDLERLPMDDGTRLYLFLGSTIGNFTDAEIHRFLRRLRACLRPHDWLLLGADRVKDIGVLNAAYNDAQGVTAAFNLNMLRVLNREWDGEFDPSRFAHVAGYNADRSRIEMHLRARSAQCVRLQRLGMTLRLARDECLLTEISRKFTRADLHEMLGAAGFTAHAHFAPPDESYSLVLARPAVTHHAPSH